MDLNQALGRIESELDEGVYRPGPWAQLLRAVRQRPKRERQALAPDLSRISDQIHRRTHTPRCSFAVGLALEASATLVGVALLEAGLERRSMVLVLISAAVLATALQPLVKIAVGSLIGVRYSYVYLFGVEPRFKMKYGTYLAADRWARVVLHLSGTLGSPLALWWVAERARAVVPRAATVCEVLFPLFAAVQVLTFALGLAGVKRLGPLGLVRSTSGGGAAYELSDRSA